MKEELKANFQVVKTIKNKPENLHVVLLCSSWCQRLMYTEQHIVAKVAEELGIHEPCAIYQQQQRHHSACVLCQPSQCRKTN